jgi:hypothetical protein
MRRAIPPLPQYTSIAWRKKNYKGVARHKELKFGTSLSSIGSTSALNFIEIRRNRSVCCVDLTRNGTMAVSEFIAADKVTS